MYVVYSVNTEEKPVVLDADDMYVVHTSLIFFYDNALKSGVNLDSDVVEKIKKLIDTFEYKE